ncbi:MAG: peptide ABC transporter permease [Rhizobiaceae bacterium]|nr:peptide ABC transporter permease [Rhizobiaceae bacterium]MCV0407291.1 peptide ABC transporter permease [Rhizobiaceae bacterium]
MRTERPREFSGRDTSQGHIVLRTPARKAIFIAGLVGFVVLSLVLALAACVPTP